jgi:aspartate-semialdehyde dehydrogenase
MASGLTVAVVGVTGAVGQTTLKLLDERKFPVKALRVFASERSVGKTVTFKGETIHLGKLGRRPSRAWTSPSSPPALAVEGIRAPGGEGRGGGRRQVERLSDGSHRAARRPEVNAHALKGHRGIVAVPTARPSSP